MMLQYVWSIFLPEHFSERLSEFLHFTVDILVHLDRTRDVGHGYDEAVAVSQRRMFRQTKITEKKKKI